MADRIPIFDEHGKYAGTLDPDTARCVWERAGLYRDNCEWVEELFRLPDGRYAWREVSMAFYDDPPHHYDLVAAGEAVRIARSGGSGVTDEMYALMLDDADRERQGITGRGDSPTAPQKTRFIVVFDETTRQERRLDTSAEYWGPTEHGRDWDGFNCYWNWTDVETLYRQGSRFVLLTESEHAELPLPAQPTCCVLVNQEAADWLIRKGV